MMLREIMQAPVRKQTTLRQMVDARKPQADEARFQAWVRALPWFSEFKQQYGEEPNLDDPDYDYRAAWRAGIEPQRYAPDGGRYHWPSVVDGKSLKSQNHPTYWMEEYMQATGRDPNDDGISREQWERMKARRR